ncbi:MAG TPA: hypothetical protein VKA46_37430 [Gemmataceae bacterium]|nr:hypothetical protein [Gemmataceae bacterium]
MIDPGILDELIHSWILGGWIEASQESILTVLATRFGSLPPDLQSSVAKIRDPERLGELIPQTVLSPDLDTFRRHLAS